MADGLKPDEPESASNGDESALDRRTFLGVGAVALAGASVAGASGLGIVQENEHGSGTESKPNENGEGNETGGENDKKARRTTKREERKEREERGE